MNDVYARLDAEAFARLVAGKSVQLPARVGGEAGTVHLILADIGFTAMMEAIEAAIHGKEPPEPCIIPPGEPLRL